MLCKDGSEFFRHLVVVGLLCLDEAVNLRFILTEEEINIRHALCLLYADDTLGCQEFQYLLCFGLERKLVLIHIGHEQCDNVVNSCREDLLVYRVKVAKHEENTKHTLSEILLLVLLDNLIGVTDCLLTCILKACLKHRTEELVKADKLANFFGS